MKLHLNGKTIQIEVDPDMPLLWAVRDHLGLTGTKFGCGMGLCGACTVHLDGEPVRACQLRVGDVGARAVTTIEGLSQDGNHPVQRAWREERVPQCGYCQSGQMMTAAAFVSQPGEPTQAAIRDAMAGNICRCGTYPRIEKAVLRACHYAKGGK